jgi:hypothetical protein
MRLGLQRSMDDRARVPVGVAKAGRTRTAGDFVMVCKAMDSQSICAYLSLEMVSGMMKSVSEW